MLIIDYFSEFMAGLWTTTYVTLLSFAIGLVLGILGATARRSRVAILRGIAAAYVEVVRNIPALVLLFFVFFGLPAFGIFFPAVVAGVIALSFHGGAYLTEVLRAGLEAVPVAQSEAARTLGIRRSDAFFLVVLPQAVRVVYPAVVTEFLQLILASSLLSVIAVNEITGTALVVNGVTFRTMEAFATALALYLLLTNAVSFGASLLAKRIFRAPAVGGTRKTKFTVTRSSALRGLG